VVGFLFIIGCYKQTNYLGFNYLLSTAPRGTPKGC
jgi:hypothetical protein